MRVAVIKYKSLIGEFTTRVHSVKELKYKFTHFNVIEAYFTNKNNIKVKVYYKYKN